MAAKRVLVVHSVREIRDVVEAILTTEGYEVQTSADFRRVFDELRQQRPEGRPALLLLELRSEFPPSVELFDRLRIDPDLRALPILAFATLEGDAALAQASFNVYGVLMLPFGADVLLRAVDKTVGLERLPPPAPPARIGPGVLGAASDLLVREQPSIVLRWVERVAVEGIYPEGRVPARARLVSMPLLIKALLAAWHPDGVPLEHLYQPETELWLAINEHVRNRRQAGASAADIVREFKLLRDIIWETFQERLPQVTARDVFLLGTQVNSALDRLVTLMLEAYERQMRDETER